VVGAEDILVDRDPPNSIYGSIWVEALANAPVTVSFLDQYYPPALGEAINDAVETVFADAASPQEALEAIEEMAQFELE
jgi:ABC-type glycerol-3-phosphate transport system substrate-binding protein